MHGQHGTKMPKANVYERTCSFSRMKDFNRVPIRLTASYKTQTFFLQMRQKIELEGLSNGFPMAFPFKLKQTTFVRHVLVKHV